MFHSAREFAKLSGDGAEKIAGSEDKRRKILAFVYFCIFMLHSSTFHLVVYFIFRCKRPLSQDLLNHSRTALLNYSMDRTFSTAIFFTERREENVFDRNWEIGHRPFFTRFRSALAEATSLAGITTRKPECASNSSTEVVEETPTTLSDTTIA